MRKRKIKADIEKRFLTGLILDSSFAERIIPLYRPELVKSDYVGTIAQWCIDYYEKHKKAIGRGIEDIYYQHEDSLDDAVRENIKDFLSILSSEVESGAEYNFDVMFDLVKDEFNKRIVKDFAEAVTEAASRKDFSGIEELHQNFALVGDVPPPKFLHVNADDIRDAFSDVARPLFGYPGPLGELLNPQLTRASFLSILAPEKRGKTWVLIDMAHRAMRAGLSVVYFDVGDMTKNRLIARFAINLAGRNANPAYCGEQLEIVPDCAKNHDGSCEKIDADEIRWMEDRETTFREQADHVPCCKCMGTREYIPVPWYREAHIKTLTADDAISIMYRFQRRTRGKLVLSMHQNDSINVRMISGIMEGWKRVGFVPDVVIIDYADILKPEPGFEQQFRHKINQTWKALRALSQRFDCCLITATQADSEGAETELLGKKHFSEDKRKRSHITAEIGLNQTEEEKQRGMMRINLIMAREDASYMPPVTVFTDIAKGQPIIQKRLDILFQVNKVHENK